MESIKYVNEILHSVFNTESLKSMCILHLQHISVQTSHISRAQLPLRPRGFRIWLCSFRLRALERQTFHQYLVKKVTLFCFSMLVILLYTTRCLVTAIIFKQIFIKWFLISFSLALFCFSRWNSFLWVQTCHFCQTVMDF